MKTLLLLTITFLFATAHAQVAPAKAPAVKLTPKDIRELPFCREFREQVFKGKDRSIGDELRVSLTGSGLHIWGKKKVNDVRHNGRVVCHMGKVALMPVGARGGKLTVKAPSAEDVTYYYAVIETAAGALETKLVTLAVGKTYTWSLKTEAGQTTLAVLEGATEIARLSKAEAEVKGGGFAATVRFVGNEADLLASID